MSDVAHHLTAYGRTVLCLPLTKFSFATVEQYMTAVPWSHKHSSDLFVVIEHVQHSNDGPLQLRIIQGTSTLETIHLTRLVQAALKVKQAHEDSFGSFKKIEHLPIFGMTKEKAMAIRYNLPDDRSRRTQMNFKDDAHRRELLSMLERLGMVITNPLPKTQQQQPLPSSTTLPLSNQSMTSDQSPCSNPIAYSNPHTSHASRSQSTLQPASTRITEPHIDHSISSYTCARTMSDHAVSSASERSLFQPAASEPPPTLQSLLPPRRQLPFARPSTSASEMRFKQSQARSSDGSTELPPLPRPSFAGGTERQTDNGSSISHPSTRNFSAETSWSDENVSPSYNTAPSCSSSSSSPTKAPSSAPRAPLSSVPTNRRIHGGTFAMSASSSSDPPTQVVDEVDAIMTNPPFRPAAGDRDALAAYAAQPRAQRMDEVNTMLSDYLQDAGFLQLCIDVEGAWRRRYMGVGNDAKP